MHSLQVVLNADKSLIWQACYCLMTGEATLPGVTDYVCGYQLVLRGSGWAKRIQARAWLTL